MSGPQTNDTIAAIATAPGTGGIGIVRISGTRAPAILRALFQPRNPRTSYRSHHLYYGTIRADDGTVLDEVLAVHMRAPKTYTTEDVVEIHCHGSHLALQGVLAQVLKQGARPARPGEFTLRAFLGGRIDLTRAEAVVDLLGAKSSSGLHMALSQLEGELQRRVEEIRRTLVTMLAGIEVAIDFPDDEVEIMDRQQLDRKLKSEVEEPLRELIEQADQGRIFREGAMVVIAGRPNVGKSSLLNALLKEERALVTPVPGTTRDTIEEYIAIRGVPIRLIDTAGIRDDAGTIEELGIRRARNKLTDADLVLLMIDGSRPLSAADHELYQQVESRDPLLVINKIDIGGKEGTDDYRRLFPHRRRLFISAAKQMGLDRLQEAIYSRLTGDAGHWDGKTCAPNTRHRVIFEKTLEACIRLRQGLNSGLPADLIAVELQGALDSLADIIGITTTEDVLETIFSRFCIGK